MKAAIVALALAAAPSAALAQYYPGTPQAPDHPNTCTTQTNPNGTTATTCQNAYTGARWMATQQPDGSVAGTNSLGQRWTYDAINHVYVNPTTGERCSYNPYGRSTC